MTSVPVSRVRDADLPDKAPPPQAGQSARPSQPDGSPDYRMIELLFFAYREFTADADEILARYGFGRAHHRILHFVNRAPGMTIADILELLQITKQSLSRVLRQLIEEGFIEQRPGATDKRQRRLYPMPRGQELVDELSRQQARRIDAALASLDPKGRESVALFLRSMADDGIAAKNWLERPRLNGAAVS